MPNRVEIEAQRREIFGNRLKRLRREGLTAAVVYGHGIESVPLTIGAKQMGLLLAKVGRTTLLSLQVPGMPERNVLVQKVQRHPVTQAILHVDFHAVRMDEKIRASVPVRLVGDSPAARGKTAMLLHPVSVLHIECLPADLPHAINVDISVLTGIDSAIHARDLTIPEGVTLLDDPETLIAKVQQTRAEAAEEAAEAAEAPAAGETASAAES